MTGPRRAALAFGALLAFTPPAPAQAPADARRAEAEIKLSLKEAVRTADAEPAKGADKLRSLLKQVEAEASLSADRRAQLARVVRDRLRVAETGPDPAAVAATEAKLADAAAAAQRQVQQTARLKAGLQAAVALEKEG